MKIPRNVSGSDLARALRVLGYQQVRQEGSHIRLTTAINGTHHVTVPAHRPLKTGTLLGGVLKPVAPRAEADLEKARDYYEEKCPGLGDRFLDAVAAAMRDLESDPLIFRDYYRGFRRVLTWLSCPNLPWVCIRRRYSISFSA